VLRWCACATSNHAGKETLGKGAALRGAQVARPWVVQCTCAAGKFHTHARACGLARTSAGRPPSRGPCPARPSCPPPPPWGCPCAPCRPRLQASVQLAGGGRARTIRHEVSQFSAPFSNQWPRLCPAACKRKLYAPQAPAVSQPKTVPNWLLWQWTRLPSLASEQTAHTQRY
jgi:hypothetical protein